MTRLEIPTKLGVTMVGDVEGTDGDPVVLLFHGGGQTRHAWRRALTTLAQRSWRTGSFDLPGHGDSGWSPDGHYPPELFAGGVAAVANAFDRPVLVGASLGGIASLLAVGEGLVEAPRALVLVDVTPRIEEVGSERVRAFMAQGADGFASLEEVADAVATYLPERPRPKDHSGLRKNVRLREDGRWVWHWDPAFIMGTDERRAAITADGPYSSSRLERAVSNVTIPILLIRGQHSDIVSDEGVAELLALAPHARVADVAGAGHMVAGDRNDRFNAALIDFLENSLV